jgi:predicted nucleotidyltransferase
VKKTLVEMEERGKIKLKRICRIDGKRLNRGVYESEDFIVNATRRFTEITKKSSSYKPHGPIEVECRCVSDSEAMFRPAVYSVEDCTRIRGEKHGTEKISKVVSMIGLYRDTVTVGERMRVRGFLEEVVNSYGLKHFRIVVGSTNPGEYIDWLG